MVEQQIDEQARLRHERHLQKMRDWRKTHGAEIQKYISGWKIAHPDYHKNYFKTERGKQINLNAQRRYNQKKKQLGVNTENKNNSQ